MNNIEINSQAFDQLPITWYPVATSAAISKGQPESFSFLNHSWLLFRTESGDVKVISRFCSHMGADLMNGTICNHQITCPLHGWRFDEHGKCQSKLPESISSQANLKSLACQEYAGIVFVFPAADATTPLPELPFPEGCKFSNSKRLILPIHYLVGAMNSFDVAHYNKVHNRKVIDDPLIYSNDPRHLGIKLKTKVVLKRWQDKVMHWLGFDEIEMKIDCWGSTILHMYNYQAKMGAFIALAPIEHNRSALYITAYQPSTSSAKLTASFSFLKLQLSRMMTIAFLKPDSVVCRGLEPREGLLVPGMDDEIKQFWQYFNQLPKTNTEHEN